MTFRDDLTEWCDWDDAAYALGNALHVFDGIERRYANGSFMTENDFGQGLHAALDALVKAGVLERRTKPDLQFRWSFAGPEHLVGARMPDSAWELPVLSGDASAAGAPAEVVPQADAAPETPETSVERAWWQRGPLSPS